MRGDVPLEYRIGQRLASAWRAWAGSLRKGWPEWLAGRSLRSNLVWLVLVCVLPAAIAAAVVIVAAYREGRAALIERSQTRALLVSRAVDAELANAIAGLEVLSTSPALAAGDLAAFDEQARRALPYLPGNNLVLSDAGGQQLLNTLLPRGEPLPPHGNPALLQRVIQHGEPVVSDLFIGGVTRRPLIAVEVPVRHEGRVVQGLAMGFFPDRLVAVLARFRADPSWIVAVLDGSGTIVARTHEPERFVGSKPPAALQAVMARGDAGAVELKMLDGTPVLASFARSATTGWAVEVGIPTDALMARLTGWAIGLAAATLALFGLGLGVAGVIARRIEAPIAALVAAAGSEHGRPVGAATGSLREAHAIADALERAAVLLASRTAERDAAAQAREVFRSEAERLTHEATHDALTGLASRSHFVGLLDSRLAACRQHGGHFSVFFVDLDDFKPVNDLHGHAVGDALLRAVATRLRASVRETDTAARLGGDEFAVLLDGLSPAEAGGVAGELIQRLSKPYSIDHLRLEVTASVGVAGFPEHAQSSEALLAAADAAMYRAKAAGKGYFMVAP
ncbi:sensor domain-containing diguanylate cyclase [Ideonella sp.]|uniref:sensor domain-containing diguanylate cyclase n=1 Tax=Ideonella sp. TaxID=1929293 RepID=UPI002B4745C1|nr:sensor domain-containing diguanylate cyclase [Ideonella sp.]